MIWFLLFVLAVGLLIGLVVHILAAISDAAFPTPNEQARLEQARRDRRERDDPSRRRQEEHRKHDAWRAREVARVEAARTNPPASSPGIIPTPGEP